MNPTTTIPETKRHDTTTELMMVSAIRPWRFNPRQGELRCIAEFAEQLKVEGVKEDLHVFIDNGVVTLMQGHRRQAACVLAGIELVWVQNHGEISERMAFEILLSLQNGTDPFDFRELAAAARTAVHEMGMTAAELAKVFHRNEATVQLYLDLEKLPHRVQEALHAGKITMELAKVFLQLPTKAMQEEALGHVLTGGMMDAPMSTAQGLVFLKDRYLRVVQREKAWEKMLPGLLRKHPVEKGFSFVAFAQRAEFVRQEATEEEGFARAEEHIDGALLVKPAEPLTWGALAGAYGVPVFVVAAPAAADKYLLLVTMRAVRECDATQEEPKLKGRAGKKKAAVGNDECVNPNAEGECGHSQEEVNGLPTQEHCQGGVCDLAKSTGVICTNDQCDIAAEFPLERWRTILAALMNNKTAVMGDTIWKPLVPLAWDLMPQTNMDWSPLLKERAADKSQLRYGMRWTFGALLALLMTAPEKHHSAALDAIEEALGL